MWSAKNFPGATTRECMEWMEKAHKRGKSERWIAETLGVSRRTVRRVLYEGCGLQPRERGPVRGEKRACGACGRELPISAFPKNSSRPSGHGYTCAKCEAKRAR